MLDGLIKNALVTKLERFGALTEDDRAVLAGFAEHKLAFTEGADVILQGARPRRVHLLVEGWACRYKILPSGKRQIVAFLLPGDLCDVHISVLRRMDHSIGALGAAKMAVIMPELILDTMERHPRLARALWWSTLVDEATLREWIVNIGRREPYERVAHLLCELWVRMRNVGLVAADGFRLPITQTDIGDGVALTPVTVNRVLQRLRRADLITLQDGELTLLDTERLMAVSGFDPAYLHDGQAPPAAH